MSDSPNAALVRRLYESGMAPDVAAEILAPDLVFDVTPGFPHGGVYHGWADVGARFFGELMPSFASFGAVPASYYGDGDHVFVVGDYHAVRPSGAQADVRFVHVWTVTDGKLAHLTQVADSYVMHELLGS